MYQKEVIKKAGFKVLIVDDDRTNTASLPIRQAPVRRV